MANKDDVQQSVDTDIRQSLDHALFREGNTKTSKKGVQKLDKEALSAEGERTEIEGRKKFFTLRNIWSSFIIIWLSSLILFNCILTILVGKNCLTFMSDPWFPRLITGETFLQIVGLGYVAVKFLFSAGR